MVTHQHAEAFKLLTFECDRCGFRENIWNSRDGLIQYTVDCPHCFGGWMRRAADDAGQYLPSYEPKPGERKFVDLAMAQAFLIAEEKIKTEALKKYRFGVYVTWNEVEPLALEFFGDGRQPDLITVEG